MAAGRREATSRGSEGGWPGWGSGAIWGSNLQREDRGSGSWMGSTLSLKSLTMGEGVHTGREDTPNCRLRGCPPTPRVSSASAQGHRNTCPSTSWPGPHCTPAMLQVRRGKCRGTSQGPTPPQGVLSVASRKPPHKGGAFIHSFISLTPTTLHGWHPLCSGHTGAQGSRQTHCRPPSSRTPTSATTQDARQAPPPRDPALALPLLSFASFSLLTLPSPADTHPVFKDNAPRPCNTPPCCWPTSHPLIGELLQGLATISAHYPPSRSLQDPQPLPTETARHPQPATLVRPTGDSAPIYPSSQPHWTSLSSPGFHEPVSWAPPLLPDQPSFPFKGPCPLGTAECLGPSSARSPAQLLLPAQPTMD